MLVGPGDGWRDDGGLLGLLYIWDMGYCGRDYEKGREWDGYSMDDVQGLG